MAPAFDIGMVAREQYIGNAHAAILRRTRVLRIFEQPIIEALVNRTALVAEYTIEPTHDRIDDHHRSELAAREHIITDRDRLVRQGIGTLIDALIMPAYEEEVVLFSKLERERIA